MKRINARQIQEHSQSIEKRSVYRFWNVKAPSTEDLGAEPTLADFEKIEQERYDREPFIHEAAQFSRSHGKKVLEVGCGAGTDFLQFVRAGAHAIGVDLTETAVLTTKRRLELYNVAAPLVQGDAECLPFRDRTFDFIYSWGVLHHTPRTDQAVREIHRLLKPGGKACVMLYHKPAWYHLKMFYVWLKKGDFSRVPFKKYVEEETDRAPVRGQPNPVAHIYTTRQALSLFQDFDRVEATVCVLRHELPELGSWLQPIADLLMRVFRPWVGFFLVIHAWKEAER
jgi:SAM-dependent methyltransferase